MYKRLRALENGFARNQLLGDHASSADHCQAAIVELLVLQYLQLFWILGLQVQWVEAVVCQFFALIVDQGSSKFVARSHDPECGPEVLRRGLSEVSVNR